MNTNESSIEVDNVIAPASFSPAIAGMTLFFDNIKQFISPMIVPIKKDLNDPSELYEVWREMTSLNTAVFKIADTLHQNTIDLSKNKCTPDNIELLKEYKNVITAIWSSGPRSELHYTEQRLSANIKQTCPHMPVEQVMQLITTQYKYLMDIKDEPAIHEFAQKLLESNFYIYNRIETFKILLTSLDVIRSSHQRLDKKRSRYGKIFEGIISSPTMLQFFHGLPDLISTG